MFLWFYTKEEHTCRCGFLVLMNGPTPHPRALQAATWAAGPHPRSSGFLGPGEGWAAGLFQLALQRQRLHRPLGALPSLRSSLFCAPTFAEMLQAGGRPPRQQGHPPAAQASAAGAWGLGASWAKVWIPFAASHTKPSLPVGLGVPSVA